jgi:hypothetical protein
MPGIAMVNVAKLIDIKSSMAEVLAFSPWDPVSLFG